MIFGNVFRRVPEREERMRQFRNEIIDRDEKRAQAVRAEIFRSTDKIEELTLVMQQVPMMNGNGG